MFIGYRKIHWPNDLSFELWLLCLLLFLLFLARHSFFRTFQLILCIASRSAYVCSSNKIISKSENCLSSVSHKITNLQEKPVLSVIYAQNSLEFQNSIKFTFYHLIFIQKKMFLILSPFASIFYKKLEKKILFGSA